MSLYKKKTQVSTSNKGAFFEEHACNYLKKMGYKILERNYRTRLGEIDVVCRHKKELVFVEVKGGKKIPEPHLRVNGLKLNKLEMTIRHYIHHKNPDYDYLRLDVISITEPGLEIKHFKDVLCH